MGLFQKKEYNTAAPLYTVGASKSVLIIGLGNPGKEYSGTRHNIGYAVVDYFAEKNDFPGWSHKSDLKADISVQTIGDTRVILCKPTTFMNLSGEAAQATQRFYKLSNPRTLVIYDELAIEFGTIRARVGGESAGHNGVKSLIQYLDEDFNRLRVGIGSKLAKNSEEFVLRPFSKEEKASLDMVIKEAAAMATEFTASGQLPHDTRTVL